MYDSDSGKYAIVDVVPSPDGSIIAVTYTHSDAQEKLITAVALYYSKTGEVEHLKNPTGHMLMHPNFSYDGTKMLFGYAVKHATIPVKISEYDLNKKEHRIVYSQFDKANFPNYPTYEPNTNNIIFFSLSESFVNSYELIKLNPYTGKREVLINADDGFYTVTRPSFTGENSIIFEALSPKNESLSEQVKEIYKTDVKNLAYKFKDRRLSIFDRKLERINYQNNSIFTATHSISASLNGAIAYANDIKAPIYSKDKSKIHRELYFYNNGTPEQLTYKKSFVAEPKISSQGNVIAMIADFEQPRVFDVYLYDVKNRKTLRTNILSSISKNTILKSKK